MANHVNPYDNVQDKLTTEQLIRQLRSMVNEEFDAATLYENLADVIDDDKVKDMVLDIAKEEIIHVGEFLALIDYLNDKEMEIINDGMSEAIDKMK